MVRPRDDEYGDEILNYWMSYSDMMAALLLVFILLLSLVMMDYRTALAEKEHEIEQILDVRGQIVLELVKAFNTTSLTLEVDPQTGAIRFPGGVLFDTDSDSVSPQGREFLNEFVPRYVEVLLAPHFRDYISEIIIEGHTDTRGGYIYNLDLSQRRAYAVARYILGEDFPDMTYRDLIKKYITANGRSFSNPIYVDGKTNADKSRRVEFKFRLKDETLVEKLKQAITE